MNDTQGPSRLHPSNANRPNGSEKQSSARIFLSFRFSATYTGWVKKFLILLPLLSACAPTVSEQASTKTSTMTSPFKVGQQWVLDGDDSKSEPLGFHKVVFTVQKTDSKGGFEGTNNDYSGQYSNAIVIQNSSNEESILLADTTPFRLTGGKIRLCIVPAPIGISTSYVGLSGYLDASKFGAVSKFFNDLKRNSPSISDRETALALLQAFAPDDSGSCTLTLIK